MAGAASDEEDEGGMDAFMDRFRGPERCEGAFNQDNWEKEFDQVPMFMKKAPSEIDPKQNPDLACLQSLIFDEDETPEEQAKTYKNEGNDYFKEKDYKKAILSYTEGLKKKCSDVELNTVLHTNRAAAQFHLGNYRSALNDAITARKLMPNHLKAIIRGALCHLELRHFSESIVWCEAGMKIDPKEKKLLETRAKADRLKRTEERDFRKTKLQEKREQSQKEALLQAIKDRNIKLSVASSEDETETFSGFAEMSLDGLSSESTIGAKVHLEEDGSLTWPVLFLYPEHGQSDFISAFREESRFIDHLIVMFEELPPWDSERKYTPNKLELYYEDEERREIYQIDTKTTLLQALQHQRYFVKAGTPTFLVLVKQSPFSKNYFLGKKVHRLN
uniref:Cns1/TTC4 wheel domain-containing protein n=1 Tax=Anolis carolinensis TaxID=28377 RepID=G1KQ35_ANOCA|nr:PREDICTED: tetratricopeptide repeat protein 4 isoform X1 [Anolis carolinensis]|eukprot:XP_008107598.1 PREDICTED: tetratricopeptide repeat protein 4 isoform X1 [Anolis carolinensis]